MLVLCTFEIGFIAADVRQPGYLCVMSFLKLCFNCI